MVRSSFLPPYGVYQHRNFSRAEKAFGAMVRVEINARPIKNLHFFILSSLYLG